MGLNRAQRRAHQGKRSLSVLPMTQQKLVEKWERNGITQADLDNAYKEGYKRGSDDNTMFVLKLVYAAAAKAAHDMAGFGIRKGEGRLRKFMSRMDELTVDWATSQEAVQQVYDETGLELRWKQDDPFASRIVRKGEA